MATDDVDDTTTYSALEYASPSFSSMRRMRNLQIAILVIVAAFFVLFDLYLIIITYAAYRLYPYWSLVGNLSDIIAPLQEQLSDVGTTMHEVQKLVKLAMPIDQDIQQFIPLV